MYYLSHIEWDDFGPKEVQALITISRCLGTQSILQWNLDNEVPRDWQNLFAITRFHYIEVLFHMFYYYWGKENRLLYRGLCYIEVCFIEVPL